MVFQHFGETKEQICIIVDQQNVRDRHLLPQGAQNM